MIAKIIAFGKRIYCLDNWRERHRFVVFVMRSLLHASDMGRLLAWFGEDAGRQRILEENPFPIEQATRAFFFAGATFAERVSLIRAHFSLLFSLFQDEWAVRLGRMDAHYSIWQSGESDMDWGAELIFEPGQRKEGLLCIKMTLGGQDLYQMIGWLAYDKAGEPSFFIGAMQGPNMGKAKDVVKETTKRAHRYRTKNLILYMTQAAARAMDLRHIYAVSNAGYYANNHVRSDRKLKTDFGAFWEEAGGHVMDDPRFYEIPLRETRKTEEEIPTRKRATYRRRFAFQDDVDAQIEASIRAIRRK